MATIVVAIASVVVSVVSLASQDGGPNMGSAPAPANYYQYDEDGNLTSAQTWNADKHAFEYRENPEPSKPGVSTQGYSLSEEEDRQAWSAAEQWTKENFAFEYDEYGNQVASNIQQYQIKLENKRTDIYNEMLYKKAEQSPEYQAQLKDWESKHGEWKKGVDARKEDKRLRTEIRTKMLGNLNQTPEDRVAAYEQYAKTFSESMQKGVTEQYEKAKQSQEERMTATGMYGSRAYADTIGEMEKEKLKADVDIAQKGELAKNELGNVDRNYWLNVLNSLDAGARADSVVGMQKAQAANQAAIGGSATLMGRYAAESQNQWNKWNADTARNMGYANTASNAAGGLMYLYGYGGGGRGGGGGGSTLGGGLSSSSYYANTGTSGAYGGGISGGGGYSF